jgi:hypothetical protein
VPAFAGADEAGARREDSDGRRLIVLRSEVHGSGNHLVTQ